MDARETLLALCSRIDAHDWGALTDLLDEAFTCRYVHTGETFDRDGWVALNAGYPGFERMRVEDVVAEGERAVSRCHVTARGDDGEAHFEVATFARVRGGCVVDMTEVWTDVGQQPPGR